MLGNSLQRDLFVVGKKKTLEYTSDKNAGQAIPSLIPRKGVLFLVQLL